MIQSAMIFALGVFVSGLVWLAFSVALVRRTRHLTERRLLAGIATRRAEFETERDELRARHAVQMYRLEREVSRVIDTATTYRLEADLKERDLVNLKAELVAREEDFGDNESRLGAQNDHIQDLERRVAESGSALRAAQHALKLETKRRSIAEEALDEASIVADQRRLALTALRAENDALRTRLGEEPGPPVPFERDEGIQRLPHALTRHEEPEEEDEAVAPAPAAIAPAVPAEQVGGSVVQLRPRNAQPDSSEQAAAALVSAATRDLQRLADDSDTDDAAEEAPAAAEKAAPTAAAPQKTRLPAANGPGEGNVAALVAHRMGRSAEDKDKPKPDVEENAETRFFEALAEIRALKRAASQAGE